MAVAKERTERDVAYGPEGLKAEAGLRGPYGTSVHHTWPTWTLLVPAVTLISALLSICLFLSLFFFLASIFSRGNSLSRSHTNIAQASRILLSFRSTQRYLWFFSVSFHLNRHLPSKSLVSHIFFLRTYTTCRHKCILGHERQRDIFTPGERCPPLSGGDENVPSNFITHRGTISIMKYFGESILAPEWTPFDYNRDKNEAHTSNARCSHAVLSMMIEEERGRSLRARKVSATFLTTVTNLHINFSEKRPYYLKVYVSSRNEISSRRWNFIGIKNRTIKNSKKRV